MVSGRGERLNCLRVGLGFGVPVDGQAEVDPAIIEQHASGNAHGVEAGNINTAPLTNALTPSGTGSVRMQNKIAGLLMETGTAFNKEKLQGKKYFASLMASLQVCRIRSKTCCA